MDDRRGERFGRYEILSELGRGAMGVVYKARDPKINRVVAVKSFNLTGQPPEEEQEFRERFFREAEAAGRLSHPGIVTIFDVGEEPDTRAPYIVMEFVGGQSLDKILSENDNKLPLEKALQITHELAEALDCANGQGVVHRDLKPANILITEEGHAKIADFGVAKLSLANQTLAGRALGTPAYMSPEQLNGDAVDGRSDLFSLGVVLYTVLTGYRPFQGNSAMTVSFKVVNRDPIPASVLDTELPQGLDYIISRAMAKEPAERYQRGMEMALDIQDLRAGRELWSKAKQPSSVSSAGEAESGKSRRASAKSGSSAGGNISGSTVAEKLAAHMQKSFAALLLFVGLAIVVIRLGPVLWSKGVPPTRAIAAKRSAPPLPVAGEAVPPRPSVIKEFESDPEAKALEPASEPEPAAHITRVRAKNLKPITAVAAAVAAPATPTAINPATLDIEIEHRFSEAHISIWVDSHLSYTHALEGTDKKRLVVFHKVEGHEFHAIQISPGSHQVKVRVTSDPNAEDHTDAISGDFASGTEKILKVRFDKHGEMALSLE